MSQGEKAPLTLRETPGGVRTQHHTLPALRASLRPWADPGVQHTRDGSQACCERVPGQEATRVLPLPGVRKGEQEYSMLCSGIEFALS
jgi:hypothetical protein